MPMPMPMPMPMQGPMPTDAAEMALRRGKGKPPGRFRGKKGSGGKGGPREGKEGKEGKESKKHEKGESKSFEAREMKKEGSGKDKGLGKDKSSGKGRNRRSYPKSLRALIPLLIVLSLAHAPGAPGLLQATSTIPIQSGLSSSPSSSYRSIPDSSNRVEYECWADSTQESYSWTRDAGTLISIIDATNTSTITFSSSHGLTPGMMLTISGETGDTDLNGSYMILTTPSPTTATITTSGVTDTTYNASGLAVAASGPRTTAEIWTVKRNVYDGSGNKLAELWAYGVVSAKVVVGRNTFVCGAGANAWR